MSQKVKEKLLHPPLFQQEKCRELIVNFKKSIELWFLSGEEADIFKEIQSSCFDIILYGLVDIAAHQEKSPPQQNNNKIIATKATAASSSSCSSESSSLPATVTCADSYQDSESDLYSPNKIIDDFEWVLNAVNIRNSAAKCSQSGGGGGGSFHTRPPTPPPASSSALQRNGVPPLKQTLKAQLTQWLCQNLKQPTNLFVFLQYLVSDKELLEEHYAAYALLRQEEYVNALFIGMSAFETRQYGLLKQIDTLLKEEEAREQEGATNETKRHKRCNSQPNVIVLSPEKKSPHCHLMSNCIEESVAKHSTTTTTVLLTIRKTKSLPEFKYNRSKNAKEDITDAPGPKPRPRCKTIADIKHKHKIPQLHIHHDNDEGGGGETLPSQRDNKMTRLLTSNYGGGGVNVEQPSTSHTSNSSTRSKSPTSSLHLNSTASTTSSSCSVATSVSSSSSKSTTRHIQLINTDDIKIWTDHSWEQAKNKHHHTQSSSSTTPAQAIPSVRQRLSINKTSSTSSKSLSPLNSFFSSLFSTPPSYTSWYTDHSLHEHNQIPETAIDSINSDSRHQRQTSTSITPTPPATMQSTPSSLSSAVLDKFLPIYGKKLRNRNTQNLFDDVSTALDYGSTSMTLNTSSSCSSGLTNTKEEVTPTTSCSPTTTTAKNCQSLTRFLQMSQSSRNNTDLEKENAHFRISEAIISAIEHIKWNKQVPQETVDRISREATPLATDCLSSSSSTAISSKVQQATCTTHEFVEGEHVPYVEDVSSVDLLTAEVVGLSLISKFDEKHMPKVSELKWLVSDDDTPQNLLPMPDLSGNNPDEHVIQSVTRGTKYWAPPRQQIIFTDHPTMDRKELLRKQNYRCAGCGMRVSPQYVQSFRYCTYLGKYHCTGCHRNQISATPAKILQNWDFKCYPVSVFAYRLLEQMSTYPLFYVPDLNPALYFRSKSLLSARNSRLQLKFVKDFIRTCRFAVREQTYFETVPEYITSDIDNWSMSDFIDAHSNCLQRSIDELIIKCENHIFNCVLCTARGFLCECCQADSVIYPWNPRVVRCDRCGSCFHRNCWKSMTFCCRCQRIDKRQEEYESVLNV
ncbi:run domain Beclin-1-interacting and cysteine-rich domain-containing protein rubicon [Musca autumnalis]|uniref:run domain Beclin-1-interacting and cysteine-rich domain-containing protein rubicon n=1 Tax=Musca autumnalis TaxID=221902 RepID=UPI003CF57EAF